MNRSKTILFFRIIGILLLSIPLFAQQGSNGGPPGGGPPGGPPTPATELARLGKTLNLSDAQGVRIRGDS